MTPKLHSPHHRSSRHKKRKEPTIWREYRFEITVVVLMALGIFLLVEEMEIRQTIWHWLGIILSATAHGLRGFFNTVLNTLGNMRASNIVGIVLIVIALAMMYTRARNRIIRQNNYMFDCPKCGNDLQRIHRTRWHKVLELLLWTNIRHYQCKECSFKGYKMDWKAKV